MPPTLIAPGLIARALIAYATTLAAFLVLDFTWLGTMMHRLYLPRMADLLAEQPNLGAGLLFYPLYVVGVVVFAVWPALSRGGPARWPRALWAGALLGLVAYGTYDITNLATLRGWSTLITVVDMAWGTCVTALAASLGTLATARLAPSRSP